MSSEEGTDYKGEWWVPGNQNQSVPGTLKVRRDQPPILDLNQAISGQLPNQIQSYEIINGDTQDGKQVTLVDCYQQSHSMSMSGWAKEELRASSVLLGHHFHQKSDMRFHNLHLGVSHLSSWADQEEISVDLPDNGGELSVSVSRPDPITQSIDSTLDIELHYAPGMGGIPALEKLEVRSSTSIRLLSTQYRRLEDFLDYVTLIEFFFSLATKGRVWASDVTARQKDWGLAPQRRSDIEVDIPRWSAYYSPVEGQKNLHDMLFTLSDIGYSLDPYFPQLFRKREILEPIYETYYGVVYSSQMRLENIFLNLVQAIEALHRRVHDPSRTHLRDRLLDLWNRNRKIMTEVSPWRRGRFVDKVKDTRHYYTHLDQSLEQRAAEGGQLHELTAYTKLLFELSILDVIGFSTSELYEFYLDRFSTWSFFTL